ncbi:YetF domain-containing protein [Orenia marismortui]|uniref:Uncharacterized membrane protein YcaP (DUF421 family) n=1 Tax=Orenia marismortui TaxID=46469 RepID=A0A4V3GY93_9FIRM|nr:DUF421 domain-containing protein [Orenia marismortui]TDX51363.1 uncharacterized membrane protein YcaP (DUF421 family) [Orenia marismortui]
MRVIIEIIIQTLVAFYATFFFARIIGKKQIGELTFYDYINGITFGSIAGNMASDLDQRTWQHFIGLFLFAALTFLMQYIALKNRKVRKVIEGEATILIHQGKILEDNLRKTRFNLEDLLSELRKNNIFDIRDAHFAILETDGKLSVLPNANKKSLTPQDLNLDGQEESICTELIADGELIEPNLKQHGLTREWLEDNLRKNNIFKIENVLFASYNPIDNSIYFDLRNDNLGKDTVDISDNKE